MTRYIVGDPITREPHPDSPTFEWASLAGAWIVAHGLDATWWPIPTEPEPQPARVGKAEA